MMRVVRRFLFVLAALAVVAALPGRARAEGECAPLPAKKPVWIDFADGSVPFWEQFARPGVVAAASNLIFPPKLRALGARTVYWDMYLNKRVGTPGAPADPATVVARANKLFDYAVQSSGCSTPYIAENELFGAALVPPWSVTNAQYRANVLLFLRTLTDRGAHPYLLVSNRPYTAGVAGDWWRQAAEVSDFALEVYFPAPAVHGQGPLMGNRVLRTAFRRAILNYTQLGIPASKLGIMLGFQTEPRMGGREGLKPASAWFETVKWQALAAKQVAREIPISTVWSWGWANWGARGYDPDKQAAACVWLWTRDHPLCDGPAAAGAGFDASLTEGQIRLPSGVQCTVDGRRISSAGIGQLQALTGDREVAFTALFARAVEAEQERVTTTDVLSAERAVIATRFGGSGQAYRTAIAKAGGTLPIARGAIADELRRSRIEATLSVRRPTPVEISSFYFAYPALLARSVRVTPAAWWLGGENEGVALSSIAPAQLFRLSGKATIRTLDGRWVVRPLGKAMALGALPLEQARPGIVAVLEAFARGAAYERWSAGKQDGARRRSVCVRDDLPSAGAVDLSTFLPFLSLTG
jgi:hypothetical protein